jgi:hypothetical protein
MTLLFGFYFPLIPLICLIIAINRHSISGTITEEHAQFPSRLDDSMAEVFLLLYFLLLINFPIWAEFEKGQENIEWPRPYGQ